MGFKSKDGTVVETVIFNGYKYNRYPESPNPAHRRYFGRAGHRLHRDVWVFHNGPIPEGHQIHHIDENTANNDISNLECLSFKHHRAEHLEQYIARGKSPKQLAHLAAINHKAKAWHKSEEGRAWHRDVCAKHLDKARANKRIGDARLIRGTRQCEWCGTEFEFRSIRKFQCSNACSTAKSKYLLGKGRKAHPYFASRLQSDS